MLLSQNKKGQVLSYDAIGGIVIFLIAVGILITYWSSLSASFYDVDAFMVLESNIALDNLMTTRVLMEDSYRLNVTRFKRCNFNPQEAGLFHEYYLQVIDADGKPLKTIDNMEGCGKAPPADKKVAVAERLMYISNNNKEYPVKIVLKVYAK